MKLDQLANSTYMAHIQGMNDKAKGKITRKMNDKAKGKITRLPDSLNPNKLIMEAMDKKYSVCPFCGESLKDRDGQHRT